MKKFAWLCLRLICSAFAAFIGLNVGFFVWLFLLLSFGYPGDRPGGGRIPSIRRVLEMNELQGALEYGGSTFFPLVLAGLFGYIVLRSKKWSEVKLKIKRDPPGTIYYE